MAKKTWEQKFEEAMGELEYLRAAIYCEFDQGGTENPLPHMPEDIRRAYKQTSAFLKKNGWTTDGQGKFYPGMDTVDEE